MTDLFQEPHDATPLTPSERDGLLQSWITHRNDLNEAERENILKGAVWARGRRGRKAVDLLTVDFAMSLHKRMFGEVWSWAGAYRDTERNIGMDAHRIAAEMPMVFDDVRYWAEHETFPPDEIAVRLHHRLAAIHPFPNGNGRHARPDGGSAYRKTRRTGIQLGRRQSRQCRRAADQICRRPAGGR